MVKTAIGVFLACILLLGCSKQKEETSLIVNGKKYSRQQIAKAALIFKQNMMNALPEHTLQSVTSDMRPIVAREIIPINSCWKRQRRENSRLIRIWLIKLLKNLKANTVHRVTLKMNSQP